MPALVGYSHISLSVRDRDASVAFYRDVFGLEPFDVVDSEGWLETVCVHPDNGMLLGFQQHDSNRGEGFDPTRTGLDHFAFRVNSHDELLTWQQRLGELGVRHSPVVDKHYGSVLSARDPDDIQLELFYRQNHP